MYVNLLTGFTLQTNYSIHRTALNIISSILLPVLFVELEKEMILCEKGVFDNLFILNTYHITNYEYYVYIHITDYIINRLYNS